MDNDLFRKAVFHTSCVLLISVLLLQYLEISIYSSSILSNWSNFLIFSVPSIYLIILSSIKTKWAFNALKMTAVLFPLIGFQRILMGWDVSADLARMASHIELTTYFKQLYIFASYGDRLAIIALAVISLVYFFRSDSSEEKKSSN